MPRAAESRRPRIEQPLVRHQPANMKKFFAKRPWIWVIIAFVILISAWSTFIRIALNNQPEQIPLEHAQKQAAAKPENARD